MKKTILNSFVGAVVFSFTCLLVLYFIKARSDTKTTTDAEPNKLYVNEGETLTAAKWNSLVDKKGLSDLHIINCGQYYSNGGVAGNRKIATWTSSLCGGDLPSNYSKCFIATNGREGPNGAHRCDKTKGYVRQEFNNGSIGIYCNYLCRNE